MGLLQTIAAFLQVGTYLLYFLFSHLILVVLFLILVVIFVIDKIRGNNIHEE